ncbi:MAG: hypothetical protein ABGY41_18065 [Candidatus Poribacteria bacterium]
MTRTSRRNYLSLWLRQGAEQQPSARLSDDVQMVQVVDDFSHLSTAITNGSAATTDAAPAAGLFIFAGVRLTAPSDRVLAVTEIQNQELVNPGYLLKSVGTVGPFTVAGVQPANLTWGGVAVSGIQEHGSVPVIPNTEPSRFAMTAGQVFDTAPILILPGESLFFISLAANAAFQYFMTWQELPA